MQSSWKTPYYLNNGRDNVCIFCRHWFQKQLDQQQSMYTLYSTFKFTWYMYVNRITTEFINKILFQDVCNGKKQQFVHLNFEIWVNFICFFFLSSKSSKLNCIRWLDSFSPYSPINTLYIPYGKLCRLSSVLESMLTIAATLSYPIACWMLSMITLAIRYNRCKQRHILFWIQCKHSTTQCQCLKRQLV